MRKNNKLFSQIKFIYLLICIQNIFKKNQIKINQQFQDFYSKLSLNSFKNTTYMKNLIRFTPNNKNNSSSNKKFNKYNKILIKIMLQQQLIGHFVK